MNSGVCPLSSSFDHFDQDYLGYREGDRWEVD